MATEIEAKIKISQKEAKQLAAILLKKGAYSTLSTRKEINEFFDTKKSKLQKSDETLRIRTVKAFPNHDKYVVTYKGPRIVSKFKSREEIEFETSDLKQTKKFFEKLGFMLNFKFEKKRLSFEYKNCVVEIDQLPKLGYFCEIEGKSARVIEKVKKELGLSDRPNIKSGYPTLLKEHVKKVKQPTKEIRF